MVENHLVGVLSYFRKLLERMGLACRKGSGPPSSSVAIYFYCCRLFSSCSTLRHSFSCHFPPCLNSQACAHLWCHDARARGANLSCTRWSSKSAVMLSRSMKSCEAFGNTRKLTCLPIGTGKILTKFLKVLIVSFVSNVICPFDSYPWNTQSNWWSLGKRGKFYLKILRDSHWTSILEVAKIC